MTEREVKVRVAGARAAQRSLEQAGWTISEPERLERNTLYDTAAGELAAERKILRVREYGKLAILTVKTPRSVDGVHSVRDEYETPADDAETLHKMLEALNFSPAWVYEKRRTSFEDGSQRGVIELDDTPIGVFLELEGPADWIDAAAESLGFSSEDYITENYYRLFERWREEQNRPEVRDMTFAAISAS